MVHRFAELLVLAGGAGAQGREVLGRERPDWRELHARIVEEGVSGGQCGGVHEADDVAGIGGVDGGAVPAEYRLRVLRGERPSGLRVGDDHAALEFAGHDPHVGEPVAVTRVHPRLHLEDHSGERVGDLADRAVDVGPPGRCGGQLDERFQQLAHTEVEHRRGEDHRRGLPGQEHLLVVVLPHLGEEFRLLNRRCPRIALDGGRRLRVE